jgi:hypothetical protein
LSHSHASLIQLVRPLLAGVHLAVACGTLAFAQQTVNVTVDAGRVLNPLTRDMVGVYTQVGDPNLLSSLTVGELRTGGFSSITYPSGWEGTADSYHWASNSSTPHPGNADAPRKPYVAPGNDMGHLVLALEKTGITPLIEVNYGSNLKGNGGGEPKEAAAWVAYANGSAESPQSIGVDASGHDWKTVGFWATLRSSSPLSSDDGYNFLRVNHPEPLRILLWQVGEDVADNGYYGGDHKGGLDLHAPYPDAQKDNEKRRKLKELSPGFYGDRVAEFAAAMKAVDPKIQVGASLTTPTSDTWAPDWNSEVLKTACKAVDFVSFPWLPGNTLPPDWKQLDESTVLNAPETDLPKIISEMLYQDRRSCPAGKVPRVVLARMAVIPWATVKNPVVPALFAADAYATLAEAGIANASWYQLRENGILNNDSKPNPAYYGTQMFHIVAFRPGDQLLASTGASSTLAVHAAHRQDGLDTVMLINKDSAAKQQVKITVRGASLANNGLRFVYGPDQAAQGKGPERAELKLEGGVISVDVPPYSIVDLILPLQK